MDYIGLDLHKNSSQVCILTEDDERSDSVGEHLYLLTA